MRRRASHGLLCVGPVPGQWPRLEDRVRDLKEDISTLHKPDIVTDIQKFFV
jgi:hypothetical protein